MADQASMAQITHKINDFKQLSCLAFICKWLVCSCKPGYCVMAYKTLLRALLTCTLYFNNSIRTLDHVCSLTWRHVCLRIFSVGIGWIRWQLNLLVVRARYVCVRVNISGRQPLLNVDDFMERIIGSHVHVNPYSYAN